MAELQARLVSEKGVKDTKSHVEGQGDKESSSLAQGQSHVRAAKVSERGGQGHNREGQGRDDGETAGNEMVRGQGRTQGQGCGVLNQPRRLSEGDSLVRGQSGASGRRTRALSGSEKGSHVGGQGVRVRVMPSRLSANHDYEEIDDLLLETEDDAEKPLRSLEPSVSHSGDRLVQVDGHFASIAERKRLLRSNSADAGEYTYLDPRAEKPGVESIVRTKPLDRKQTQNTARTQMRRCKTFNASKAVVGDDSTVNTQIYAVPVRKVKPYLVVDVDGLIAQRPENDSPDVALCSSQNDRQGQHAETNLAKEISQVVSSCRLDSKAEGYNETDSTMTGCISKCSTLHGQQQQVTDQAINRSTSDDREVLRFLDANNLPANARGEGEIRSQKPAETEKGITPEKQKTTSKENNDEIDLEEAQSTPALLRAISRQNNPDTLVQPKNRKEASMSNVEESRGHKGDSDMMNRFHDAGVETNTDDREDNVVVISLKTK